MKGTTYMDYGLWLLSDDAGTIILTGWSETADSDADPTAATKAEHWPIYTICQDRARLPDRLAELGLDLAPGVFIGDLDKEWDVYVRHHDIAALRTRLDSEQTRNSG